MNQLLTPITELIPESNIIVFSPHFDDFLFMMGGYVDALKKLSLHSRKKFHIQLIFSRSNYTAGAGKNNFTHNLDRLKEVTGKRLLEDQDCIDEMLGRHNYRYELLGEVECFARGKKFADSEMEFPHGMFEDFDDHDREIFSRMKKFISGWSEKKDTALIFPLAFKEHIDHFIVREAAAEVATENPAAKATFYFHEDKPYGGLATGEEMTRTMRFIREHSLQPKTYAADPEYVIDLAFRHYTSQVEEVYKKGIRERAAQLKNDMGSSFFCDRIYVLK